MIGPPPARGEYPLAYQRQQWAEDAAWMARLESEAVTEEQKAFARGWREVFEARLKEGV